MSYKYSSGYQIMGDISGSDDANRNTGIDFEEDYISLVANGSSVMVVSGSNVGIGTTTPDYTLDVAGDIGVNHKIYHNGDANTYINFTDDRIRFDAGGLGFIGMHKKDSSPHQVTINNGNNNIDFVVNSNNNSNDPILRCDASAASVGIRTASPIAELDVAGKIAITEESSTPNQPADGQGYLYTKSDGKLYWRSHDVSETDLTQAGGGGGGGSSLTVVSPKTGNYTASNNEVVPVNLIGSSGDVTITLPAASSNAQVVVKISGNAEGKIVTVDGNGSQTIDGSATRTMDSDNESMFLISDGSNWLRIS